MDIDIDNMGNVWIAYSGSANLTKFNGVNWRLYLDPYLSTSPVSMVKSDNNGNVYYNVASALNKYDAILDTVVRISNSIGSNPIGIDYTNTVWTTGFENLTQSVELYKNAISSNSITYTLSGLNLFVNSLYSSIKKHQIV